MRCPGLFGGPGSGRPVRGARVLPGRPAGRLLCQRGVAGMGELARGPAPGIPHPGVRSSPAARCGAGGGGRPARGGALGPLGRGPGSGRRERPPSPARPARPDRRSRRGPALLRGVSRPAQGGLRRGACPGDAGSGGGDPGAHRANAFRRTRSAGRTSCRRSGSGARARQPVAAPEPPRYPGGRPRHHGGPVDPSRTVAAAPARPGRGDAVHHPQSSARGLAGGHGRSAGPQPGRGGSAVHRAACQRDPAVGNPAGP